jgi:hypothetical protein
LRLYLYIFSAYSFFLYYDISFVYTVRKMTTAKEIKIALIKRDITGAEIARRHSVTKEAVYHTIAGRRKSPYLRQAIADELNIPYKKLWGGSR